MDHDEMCLCDDCFCKLTGVKTKKVVKQVFIPAETVTVKSIEEIIYYAVNHPKQIIMLSSK